MRLTAAFTAAHARRWPYGTQGYSRGGETAQPLRGGDTAAQTDGLPRREPFEHGAVVGGDGEKAPAVVEAADHQPPHRRAVAVVEHRVGLDGPRSRRLARELGCRLGIEEGLGCRGTVADEGSFLRGGAVNADRMLRDVPAERRDEPDRSRPRAYPRHHLGDGVHGVVVARTTEVGQ